MFAQENQAVNSSDQIQYILMETLIGFRLYGVTYVCALHIEFAQHSVLIIDH